MAVSDHDYSNWSLGAALGAAVAASACCAIPLALVSLGIGGAWISGLTALAPYRWMFVTLAVGALAYAGFNEWQLSRRPDCNCETVFSSTTRRSVLGAGALAVLTLVASPWLLHVASGARTQQAQIAAEGSQQGETPGASATPASFRQVVLEVEGMTCPGCPETVKTALKGIDGVYRVEATYKPPTAVVRFDPKTVSVDDLTRVTESAGFPSSPKSAS